MARNKRFNEEMAIINGKGTWSADGSTLTLENGRVLTKEEQWSERHRLLTLGEQRARALKAAGKGPKGRTAGQRAFAGWVMKAGYG
jgi:uncharacterized cupin superfamily protein